MKTIDEVAQEYAESINEGGEWTHHERIASDGFKDGAEFAQRWIHVEEELPNNKRNVLYKDSDGKEFLAFYIPELKKWMKFRPIGSPIECNNITHWRPIELK